MNRTTFALILLSFSGLVACSLNSSAEEETTAKTTSTSAATAEVGNWPRFRGPKLDGISRETAWRKSWTEDPPQLWKANIGTGYSGISVAGGKLYTMGHAEGNDTVWCLDALTGEGVWKHSYACELVNNLHDGGPAATPTVAGGMVYTLSKEGHFFCFDAKSGKIVWQRELQADLGVKMPGWGFSSSPLVWRDLIYVDGGCVAAYRKTDGELVWKSAPYKPGYGSVAAMLDGERRLVTVLNNEFLMVLDAADGTEVAKTKWETSFETNANTPIVSTKIVEGDITIFISTGYNRGCALFRLVDGELEYIYDNKEMNNHMANCVLYERHLYGIDGNSHAARVCAVTCLDAATGEKKWGERGLGCGTLLLADKHLIVLGDEGKLVVAPVSTEEFKPVAEAKILEGTCWTLPTLAGGILYARNSAGDLVAVDLREAK